ncbi:MAG: ABC transporter ATP-binding protein [Beijerinckiaceae bacterium]|nr:ABC transporter ATP-binding protein [Beijerinckiaceae bacterium]
MLSCRGAGRIFHTDRGPVDAVRAINLDVPAGRYLAVNGRSGSGKSTLMAMIGGLCRPTMGAIFIDGADIWSLSDSAMAEFRNRRIGYVFQFASLLPTLRAIDNVALPALLGRRNRNAGAYDRAARLLTEIGLGSHLDAFPSEMSAGEQRRTAVARALINDPVLLLADEPASDLDLQTETEIMALLADVNRERGTTLLLVTHNVALASKAEHVVQIADGAILP